MDSEDKSEVSSSLVEESESDDSIHEGDDNESSLGNINDSFITPEESKSKPIFESINFSDDPSSSANVSSDDSNNKLNSSEEVVNDGETSTHSDTKTSKSNSAELDNTTGSARSGASTLINNEANMKSNASNQVKSENLSGSDSIHDVLVIDSPVSFKPRKVKIIDSSSESEDEESDVIDVSSGAEEFVPITPKRQLTLPQMLNKQPQLRDTTNIKQIQPPNIDFVKVSRYDYDQQKSKVETLRSELLRMQNLIRTVNLAQLPDGGEMLNRKSQGLKEAVSIAEEKFKYMVIDESLVSEMDAPKSVAWEDLKLMSESVQPRTFGQQAMATVNAQKTMTMESLQQLHSTLTTCPTEDTLTESPIGLRAELMPHQKYALSWLLWRENQKPSGGILADDMGLGKTLTMISLLLKIKELSKKHESDDSDEENRRERNSKHKGGTLVICPASLLNQWESEVEKHCKRYTLSVEIYHGAKRETRSKRLAQYDMVITTYTICSKEHEKPSSALYGVRWRRIILDEAHQIRNPKSKSSIAACELRAQSRWALTGTPVHNKELDMYSLLKFLRCHPFDDLAIWKRWIANKQAGGQDRLRTVISSIMLRRTKAGLQEKGNLQTLPEKHLEVIEVSLEADEQLVYQKLLIFSKTLFAQYLHQQGEKFGEYRDLGSYSKMANDASSQYSQIYQRFLRIHKDKQVKAAHILVLLLRLRQMCCHPSLIVKMLDNGQLLDDEDIAGGDEFNILEEMKKLNLNDESTDPNPEGANGKSAEIEGFDAPLKDLLNPENPIFFEGSKSTKIKSVLKVLNEKVLPTREKVIIVSQWTRLLHLLSIHLEQEKISFEHLDGSVPVPKRMDIVRCFNTPSHPTKILLLSLTAGGVGLNLIGGNHMILLDLHWNPQLEMQAHDRIYRVGQTKSVHIYKLVTMNTIEERIKALQEHKLGLASSMLTGAKIEHTKLSLQELKMLFNM